MSREGGNVGHTIARVKLCNPHEPERCLELELLVDTGSTYTWVRRERLQELGIDPTGRRRFRTIRGELVERDVGEAVIECLGERATCMVAFAEEGDSEVLGITTLENLGLEVDPITRQLKKAEALLALALSARLSSAQPHSAL